VAYQCQKVAYQYHPTFISATTWQISLPPIKKNTPSIFWIATPLGKMGILKW